MVLRLLMSAISTFFSFLYDLFISRSLTVSTYQHFFMTLTPPHSLLDIGVGTGLPLQMVQARLTGSTVVGIDIDPHYVESAKARFAESKNISIQLADIRHWNTTQRFQQVLFSFSFMLIPNRSQCLQKVRRLLQKEGEVIFFMTLDRKRSLVKQTIKPLLKYVTSIDFGEVVYQNDFKELLQKEGMQVISDELLRGRWVFKLADVHVVRARFL